MLNLLIHNYLPDASTEKNGEKTSVATYIKEFKSYGCKALIRNLSTHLSMLEINGLFVPITINDEEYENTYVCSPYTAFVSYALEELHHLRSPTLQYILGHAIQWISAPLKKAKINRVAAINNWMLSTNLYPSWPWERLQEITNFLQQEFSQHYIIFRSLNSFANRPELAAFRKVGYRLLPTRQVYIYPIRDEKWQHRHNVKMDFRLLDKTSLRPAENEDIVEPDYVRIEELYHMLYIAKYSKLNPQYTAAFMKLCHQNKIMRFRGLRDMDGKLCAITGNFTMGRIITAPIVGYDTGMPQKLGLYRLAIALVMQTALREGLDLHLSAGAASFKRLRGGIPYIEYSAIYDRHLPWRQRITSVLLTLLTKLLFIPLMKIFKL